MICHFCKYDHSGPRMYGLHVNYMARTRVLPPNLACGY